VFALCFSLLPHMRAQVQDRRLDVAGAITVTAALMLAVYAIVNGNEAGWSSTQTLGLLGAAAVLLAVFLIIESRVAVPLMPFSIFRIRSMNIGNFVAVLWAMGMFTWFFMSALYMQLVLGLAPMQVGLAFLPANIIMAVFSLGLSAKLVTRFGVRTPLGVGLVLAALGLALFALAPVHGDVVTHILPSMVLLGLGGGLAFNPLLMATMSDVPPSEAGLASGLANTAFVMGGSLGLAILASVSAARTHTLLAAGASQPEALTGGYHVAFLVGAIAVGTGALIGCTFLRNSSQSPSHSPTASPVAAAAND
jgi:MFS family permease